MIYGKHHKLRFSAKDDYGFVRESRGGLIRNAHRLGKGVKFSKIKPIR